jgi:ferredoxin, 2Fe-2S
MPTVVFITQDSDERPVEVPAGTTLLSAAVKHGIDGIIGECGGVCMCATCHVYIREDFFPRLPPAQDTEEAVLEVTNAERLPNSRLACQIKVTEELDGLTVVVPPSQR